ncbi:Oidioi.mRNA.OKI2018_I69.chr1.g3664.t1.cds [Oikopleura dioica]|uniref:Oidioi.mRNA.OKI2018_I69.chr1.g3664.t1.cds n=1 Tax=Oikopleura dioica TaxID=34765 RepID=A0ABN7SZ50_OIKDI|nr:Oidioi.mRNA.OKI2018_I69.chr1.g3664.t1.cds [Oikopleura dioica]
MGFGLLSRKRRKSEEEIRQDEKATRTQFNSFSDFRKDGILTDVVIIVPGHPEIKAHKMVLAAASPFFQAMFKSGLRESSSDRVEMPEIDYEAAQILVDFAYCGNYKITEGNVRNLLAAADCYQFEEIKKKCESFLIDMIDADNCFELEKIGDARGLSRLSSQAGRFSMQNFEEVIKSKSFTELSFEELENYLCYENDGPLCYSEVTFYNGIVTWIKSDLEKRSQYATKLFVNCVRLGRIHKNFIWDVVEKEPLFSDAECKEHILLAWKFKAFYYDEDSDREKEFGTIGKIRNEFC